MLEGLYKQNGYQRGISTWREHGPRVRQWALLFDTNGRHQGGSLSGWKGAAIHPSLLTSRAPSGQWISQGMVQLPKTFASCRSIRFEGFGFPGILAVGASLHVRCSDLSSRHVQTPGSDQLDPLCTFLQENWTGLVLLRMVTPPAVPSLYPGAVNCDVLRGSPRGSATDIVRILGVWKP